MSPVPKQPHERQRHFLKEWREYRNLTQQTAAARLDIDQSTLSRIERRQIPYDQDFLEQAAAAYNCNVADLIMRNPLDKSAPWAILETVKKLPKHRQTDAVRIIRALAATGTDE